MRASTIGRTASYPGPSHRKRGSWALDSRHSWLLRAIAVTLTSSYAYAVPVVAYLTAVLALGEPFHPAVLPGAATTIAAVAAEARVAS